MIPSDETSTDGSYPMRISTPKPRVLLRSLPMFELLTALVSDASAWWSLALFMRRVILIVIFSIPQVTWSYRLLVTLLVTGVWLLARMYAQIFDRATSNRLHWADLGLSVLEVWYLCMITLITKDVNEIDAVINPNKATMPPSSSTSQAQSAALAAVAASALAVILVVYVLFRAVWDDVSLHRQARSASKSGRAPLLANVGPAGAAMVNPSGASTPRSSRSKGNKEEPVAFLAPNSTDTYANAPLQPYMPPAAPMGAGFIGNVQTGPVLTSPGAETAATGTTTGTTKSKKSKKKKKTKGKKNKRRGFLAGPDSLDEEAFSLGFESSLAMGRGDLLANAGGAGAPAVQALSASDPRVAENTKMVSPQARMQPAARITPGIGTSGTPPVAPGSASGHRLVSTDPSLDSLSRPRTSRKRLGKKGKKGKSGKKSSMGKRNAALSPEEIAEDRPLSPEEAVEAGSFLSGFVASPSALDTGSRGGDSVSGFSSVSRGLEFEEEAKCPHCGVAVLASARFCHQCGGNVDVDAAHASRALSDDKGSVQ